jgi:DNA-binding IclR family transcriptional regulator
MPKPAAPSARRRRPKWAVAEQGRSAADGKQSPYNSRNISRALDVLEAFLEERQAMTLKDLGHVIGIPNSSLFRVLTTLQSRGYLQQNDDGSYQLAQKVLLGKLSERAQRFRELARTELHSLAGHFNETASLAYLFGDHIQVIDSVDSLHEIRITNRPGRVLPPHCSAMGKAITAFQDREKINRILESYGLAPRTPNTIVDSRELISRFARIRETGVAYDREESVIGGVCVAAAVQLPDHRVIAAVSVSTPIARMSPDREKETAASVLQTASELARLVTKSIG